MTRQAQKTVVDETDETNGASVMMTLGEAAMVLGIHRTTAWNLYKRGEFPVPVLKIGSNLRIVKAQLELFIETGVPIAFPTSTGSASIAS
jgi:excisionase family DNA binding protein